VSGAGRRTTISTYAVVLALAALARPALAQSNRDSLAAGRAAYDRADFSAAVRLLTTGLDPNAGPLDSAWANGVHKLAHAMLQTGDTSTLHLWMLWANRAAPGFPIDTLLFPPVVQHAIQSARAGVRATAADSLVATTWEWSGDHSGTHGVLKLGRAPGLVLGVVDSVGTMLPDERRTLTAGTYTIQLSMQGAASIRVTREVLPGVTTVITPRPRAVSTAVTPAEHAAAVADTSAQLAERLTAGNAASCFSARAAAFCWGSNAGGLLGGGWTDSTRAPVVVSGRHQFTVVSIGGSHACALNPAGEAYCWGAGASGQLGNGATTSSASPVAVSGGQVFTDIASGTQHTCALARSGAVFCWGAGTGGQLGNHANTNSAVPVAANIPAGTTFKSVVAGGNHTCALTSRGAAWCWGAGSSGELGNGSTNGANVPVTVSGDAAFQSLAAGTAHTCGLLSNGHVLCWGANGSGQLGSDNPQATNRPTPISDSTVFIAITAGDQFTCGLTATGAAWCWGAGGLGQLGNGRAADSQRPALVVGGLTMRAIAAGNAHACAATADRKVWCWGSNESAQIGALAGRTTTTPVPVLSRPAPRAAAAGAPPRHTLYDSFDHGTVTTGVPWRTDSVAGAHIAVDSGELVIARTGSRGAIGAAGVALPVRIAARGTAIRFDVRVDSNATPGGCGLNCAEWPAMVRVRVKNRDFTESEVWYVFGPANPGWNANGVTLVATPAPNGQWLRRERFMIEDADQRADSIIEVAFGGIGTDFRSRFDNIVIPAPIIASVTVTPDSARITESGGTVQLTAEPRDSSGGAQSWPVVTWSSSDTAVARVSPTGLVTATGNGTAQIHASAEEASATVKIVVRVAPERRRPTRRPRRP